jgi:hypothetical protein
MITRHFYRLDEVQAALCYAILKGRPLETAFWVQELLDSGRTKELQQTLIQAWLWFVLVNDPMWIHYITDPHQAAYRLAVAPKDNSLWALCCLLPNPDTLCSNIPVSLKNSKPTLERYFAIALHQKKGQAACWAALRLAALGPLELPVSLSPLLGDLDGSLQICVSVLLACSVAARTPCEIPEEINAQLARWASLLGRRARRCYGIPQECLYGLTRRGCLGQKESTLGELRGIHDQLVHEQGIGEEGLEPFYQAVFPDDIPDEWSLADQMRSHGAGVLRTSESAISLSRLGRIWFQAESRFAWGFYEWVGFDRVFEGPVGFDWVAKDLDAGSVEGVLTPMRKMRIVA